MAPLRHHMSGSQKRRNKKKREELDNKLKGSMFKYLTKPSEVEEEEHMGLVDDELDGEDVGTCSNEPLENEEEEELVDNENEIPLDQEGQPFENFDPDPSTWRLPNPKLVDYLVKKGPVRVPMDDVDYPKDTQKRRFTNVNYTRKTKRGEKYDRKWLLYSKSVDRVYCFCCKLFKIKDGDCQLDGDGMNDWHNMVRRLKNHEESKEHLLCMGKWYEFEKRLEHGKTIDKKAQDLLSKEKERLKQVLFRIIGAIKYLAKNNLAFRGSNDTLYADNNENFLGLIEYISTFDFVMEDHIRRFKNNVVRHHYLSHKIQNEFIEMVANAVKSAIIQKIKKAKFYSVIFDCTPDVSREVINRMSKELQSESMHIDRAIDLLNGLMEHFHKYRENGFDSALQRANDIAQGLDIEPVFPRPQKRIITKKRHFDEIESSSEGIEFSSKESFRVEYFIYIVDKALASLKARFDTFREYQKNFGFLLALNKSSIDDESLRDSCKNLSTILENKSKESDIDPDELFGELKILSLALPKEIDGPLQILEFLKRCGPGYSNSEVAYRILLTIPVTVASGERSFSKLKLIKNHLRSTMTQERLNGLAMISIEKKMVDEIDDSSLIDDFASRCAS